jgi:hypothetical protein
MNIRNGVRDLLRLCGHALTSTVHERLDAIERRLDQLEKSQPQAPPRSETPRSETPPRDTPPRETETALLQASIHIIENLHALAGRVVVETGAGYGSPEAGMAAFLYSHVPHRTAIETHGRTNLALAEAGYEVYRCGVKRHALGSVNGRGSFMTAAAGGSLVTAASGGMTAAAGAGVSATGTDVHVEPRLPDAIGLMSLGGEALARLRETGDFGAPVVAADLEADFVALVVEMRRREYHWHVALYRSPTRDGASYFANYPGGVPDAEGSVFFFRDFRVFSEAQAWCAATLPRTYFRPPQD